LISFDASVGTVRAGVGFSPPTRTHLVGTEGCTLHTSPWSCVRMRCRQNGPSQGDRLVGYLAAGRCPTTRTSAVGRLERGEPGSLGSGGGGLHAVCHRRGLNRLGRPTFPISTTKWSSSTRLVTRTKESNVRASMRVKWKPECGAKAKMGGKWQRFRPGHRTIDLCGFVHTRVRARPLGPERLRTMPV